MRHVLEAELSQRGFRTSSRASGDEGLALLATDDFDVVLTDVNMPGMTGVDLCHRIVSNREDLPVVVMTAFGNVETAVLAIRAGAYDFVMKPFDIADLVQTLERAEKHRALREEVRRLRRAVDDAHGFDKIVGTSAPMQKVFDLVGRVADGDTNVLITGESGTGKELVARAVHERSQRSAGPFVAINCAAMPEPLLESELFGHVKGAFTDARQARSGLVLQASKGTLFLDEIGDMPPGVQAKLLRVLQERTVRPVGGDAVIPFDVRLITATNRDLESEVDEKRFREDLFYRINVVRIHLPPLRSRATDILPLAQHYLTRYAAQGKRSVTGMTAAAAEKLVTYPWPGNVRELQNCMERAVALAVVEQIGVDDLPEKVRSFKATRVVIDTDDPSDFLPMEEVERRYVLRVLEAVGGNKTTAAQILGFDRRTLYRKLDGWGARDKKAAHET
jgi:two-component system response regulator HydG